MSYSSTNREEEIKNLVSDWLKEYGETIQKISFFIVGPVDFYRDLDNDDLYDVCVSKKCSVRYYLIHETKCFLLANVGNSYRDFEPYLYVSGSDMERFQTSNDVLYNGKMFKIQIPSREKDRNPKYAKRSRMFAKQFDFERMKKMDVDELKSILIESNNEIDLDENDWSSDLNVHYSLYNMFYNKYQNECNKLNEPEKSFVCDFTPSQKAKKGHQKYNGPKPSYYSKMIFDE